MTDFEDRLRDGLAELDRSYTPAPDLPARIARRTRQRERRHHAGYGVLGCAAVLTLVLGLASALGLTSSGQGNPQAGKGASGELASTAPTGSRAAGDRAGGAIPSTGATGSQVTGAPSPSGGSRATHASGGQPSSGVTIVPEGATLMTFPNTFQPLPGTLPPPPPVLPPVTQTLPPTTLPPTTVPPATSSSSTTTSSTTTTTTCPATTTAAPGPTPGVTPTSSPC